MEATADLAVLQGVNDLRIKEVEWLAQVSYEGRERLWRVARRMK